MQLTVIGAGYVGLVSAACFAELGHHVTCIDTDSVKIDALKKGMAPIYEEGLETLLEKNLKDVRIHFTTDWPEAIEKAEAVFIAVGTPSSRRGSGYADLSYVYEASKTIAQHLKRYAVIVNKSTVPVGTAKQVERIIRESNPEADFDVASNPEFLREGAAIQDFMNPDRIIIGTTSVKAKEYLLRVYRSFLSNRVPVVTTTTETAELIKYASNSFLATKISFINEIASFCETVGADIKEVAYGMGLDARIGSHFLQAGPGYGGSCSPKDPMALVRMAQEHGSPCRIVETAIEANNVQKVRMIRKIREAIGQPEELKTLAVLGLTFKPGTDDMRDAPSITILPALLERGIRVRAHDPQGMEEAKKFLPDIEYCNDFYAACEKADAVCLMTDWECYRALDFSRLKKRLKQPVFIDLRNVYLPQTVIAEGFKYVGVGRRPSFS